jgi:hypothetical protein
MSLDVKHWPWTSAAVLVDLLLQRCPGGVEPLQVAEDRRQGRGQAVAADPGDGRLDGFQSTVQLGDLAAPLNPSLSRKPPARAIASRSGTAQ